VKSYLRRQLTLFSSTKNKVFLLCWLATIALSFALVFTQMPAEGNAQSAPGEQRTSTIIQVAPPQSSSSSASANASNSASAPVTPILGPQTSQKTAVKKVPVYRSSDFLAGYLTNQTDDIIVEGKPWINASTNVAQYQTPLGGNSFWDYWGESEKWDSTNHMWRDDQGNWHLYETETSYSANGRERTAYILVDRDGPGVMDELWFTHDASATFFRVWNIFQPAFDPAELLEWGNLQKLGNLRIEVDKKVVYDGPVVDWFSGKAQNLTPDLTKILVWRYQDFGSDGNIIPIPYQEHIKVSVSGGTGKPKWFMATGITLPKDTRLRAYSGSANAMPEDEMANQANYVLMPETFIDAQDNQQTQQFNVAPNAPAALQFGGSGKLTAMQIKIHKKYDPKNLQLRVKYGDETGIDMPLIAFFGEPDQISLHHSSPIGIIDQGDSYLFYCNYPMPYQKSMTIEISSNAATAALTLRMASSKETNNTQFRVLLKPTIKLETYGPDYAVVVPGDGKIVGLVLVTKDQEFLRIPKVYAASGKEDPSTMAWGMGYLEGNLNMFDGSGNGRLYSGQEDWVDGGYYFNSGYTTPPGGGNRPFGGVLRYREGDDGYATLFRYFNDLSAFRFKGDLHLMFGHGTWRNNFPVKYGATVYYYQEVSSGTPVALPASEYIIATGSNTLP
jgi:DUF2961 family protein